MQSQESVQNGVKEGVKEVLKVKTKARQSLSCPDSILNRISLGGQTVLPGPLRKMGWGSTRAKEGRTHLSSATLQSLKYSVVISLSFVSGGLTWLVILIDL